jgi:hypothetical protein
VPPYEQLERGLVAVLDEPAEQVGVRDAVGLGHTSAGEKPFEQTARAIRHCRLRLQ